MSEPEIIPRAGAMVAYDAAGDDSKAAPVGADSAAGGGAGRGAAADRGPPPLSLLSWNVLAECYHNPTEWPCPGPSDWPHRLQALLAEIIEAGADVVLLQEVEPAVFHDILLRLRHAGYAGALQQTKNRTRQATFWKIARFGEAAASAGSSNRGLHVVLRHAEGGRGVGVVNVHLEGDPHAAVARVKQLHSALRGLAEEGADHEAVLIAGDFNCTASSAAASYLAFGAVPDGITEWGQGIDAREFSAFAPHGLELAAVEHNGRASGGAPRPRRLGAAVQQQQDADYSAADTSSSWSSEWSGIVYGEAPVDFSYTGMPAHGFSGMLDQCWHSSALECTARRALFRSSQEPDAVLAEGIPNGMNPSDHMPIGAVFRFRERGVEPLLNLSRRALAEATRAAAKATAAAEKAAREADLHRSTTHLEAEVRELLSSLPIDAELKAAFLEATTPLPGLPHGRPSPQQLMRLAELRAQRSAVLVAACDCPTIVGKKVGTCCEVTQVLERVAKLQKARFLQKKGKAKETAEEKRARMVPEKTSKQLKWEKRRAAEAKAEDRPEVAKKSFWSTHVGRWHNGALACSGRPRKAGVDRFVSAGATTVVTLLRADELAPSETGGNHDDLPALVESAGLRFVHAPLSGKKAVDGSKDGPSDADRASLEKAREVAAMLVRGDCIIVHCAAGMHRTGVFCFLVLRHAGLGVGESLATLESMRSVTHAELVRQPKQGPTLAEQAEAFFQQQQLKEQAAVLRPREAPSNTTSSGGQDVEHQPGPAAAPAPVRFGTIGSNFVSEWFVEAAATIPDIALAAIYSRTSERAAEFAAQVLPPGASVKLYASLEALAADESVDAVYIASPTSEHARHATMMMRAGKHVLIEKPICSNSVELDALLAVAKDSGKALMEAMRSVATPNFAIVKSMLATLPPVRHLSGTFCQLSSRWPAYLADPANPPNAFLPDLSCGCLMDLGCYAISTAVALLGAPKSVSYSATMLPTGVDSSGTIVLTYKHGLATLVISKQSQSWSKSELQTEDGTITIDHLGLFSSVKLQKKGDAAATDLSDPEQLCGNLQMAHELQRFVALVRSGRQEDKLLSWALARQVMAVLDACRRDAGIVFPADLHSAQESAERPAAAAAVVDASEVAIDGSFGEGGGQVIRACVSLMWLSPLPLRLFDIRKGREARGGGGLKPQHLASVRLAAQLGARDLSGDEEGSTEMMAVVAAKPAPSPAKVLYGLAGAIAEDTTVLADAGTAGATTLMLQAGLPGLVFAAPAGTQLVLRGGTDVNFSPPSAHFSLVLAPLLKRMGLDVDMRVVRRGFVPVGGGEIRVTATAAAACLAAITLVEQGTATKVVGSIVVAPGADPEAVEALKVALEYELPKVLPQTRPAVPVQITLEVCEDGKGRKKKPPPCAIQLAIHTTSSSILSWNDLSKTPATKDCALHTAKTARRAAKGVATLLGSAAAVDEHTADQLIVWMALATGKSTMLAPLPAEQSSEHLATVLHFAQQMVPGCAIRVNEHADGLFIECEGAGVPVPGRQ